MGQLVRLAVITGEFCVLANGTAEKKRTTLPISNEVVHVGEGDGRLRLGQRAEDRVKILGLR